MSTLVVTDTDTLSLIDALKSAESPEKISKFIVYSDVSKVVEPSPATLNRTVEYVKTGQG